MILDSTAPPAIAFRNVSIEYDPTRRLLTNFNAVVAPHEHVVFAGRSGSGKSSLLLALLGFAPIAGGTIAVQGRTLDALTIWQTRAAIAYVPQTPLTAAVIADNDANVQDFFDVLFRLRLNRKKKPAPELVLSVLNELVPGERAILKQSLRRLSGGEKQRVALAAALLLERPLLVLDEPTAALDTDARALVIAALRRRPGLTVLSVSHDPVWIAACDREIPVVRKS